MRSDFGWKLPERITVRLGKTSYGKQRTIYEEGHLLLILHQPPEPNEKHPRVQVFWRKPTGEWQCKGGGE